MRLAYLLSHYPRASQVFLQRELAGLRELGVEVQAVSIRRSRDLHSAADREEAERTEWLTPARPVRLLRAHGRAALRHPAAWLGSLAWAWREAPPGGRLQQVRYWGGAVVLWDLLRRLGIDHVHAHFATNASDVAMTAVRLGQAAGEGPRSFSLHLHGPTDFFDVERNRVALKAREATGVICVSDYARAQTLAWLDPAAWAKVVVARYGAPVPDVAAGAADGPLRVLNVARLAGVKGHVVLLDALARVVAAGHDVVLDVVGDGPLAADLRVQADALGIAERVRWHGALGHGAVAALYAQAGAFCLPSFAEGLPVVVLEAMAAGLPVIATRITGVPEALTDGRDGLLVAPARPDELAAALERLATDPELRARLGSAARERIIAERTEQHSARDIRDALRVVVPEAR